MLKINLSGNKEKKQSKKKAVADPAQASKMDASGIGDAVPEETQEVVVEEKEPVHNKKRQTILLVILLIVAIGAAGYFYKDKIISFFPKKAPVVTPVAPPPPSPPKPVAEEKEPDPAFVLLNRLGDSITPHVWLTSAVIKYDGSYLITGLAFSFKSMTDMVSSLEGTGTVTSKTIPPQSKSSETVYRFSANGTLGGVKVPEVLDAIPTDNLVAAAETVKSREKEFGITFTQLPKTGAAYMDKDMPFSLEGTYTGLKRVVEILCPEGGDVRIFNLRISPSTPGRGFDRVKASFSLKTTSSI